MHRVVSLVFSISLGLVPAIAIAQVQSGSTGGAIGKRDKSISGEEPSVAIRKAGCCVESMPQ